MTAYRIEMIVTTDEPLKNASLMAMAYAVQEVPFIKDAGGDVQHIDMKEVRRRGEADEDTRDG